MRRGRFNAFRGVRGNGTYNKGLDILYNSLRGREYCIILAQRIKSYPRGVYYSYRGARGGERCNREAGNIIQFAIFADLTHTRAMQRLKSFPGAVEVSDWAAWAFLKSLDLSRVYIYRVDKPVGVCLKSVAEQYDKAWRRAGQKESCPLSVKSTGPSEITIEVKRVLLSISFAVGTIATLSEEIAALGPGKSRFFEGDAVFIQRVRRVCSAYPGKYTVIAKSDGCEVSGRTETGLSLRSRALGAIARAGGFCSFLEARKEGLGAIRAYVSQYNASSEVKYAVRAAPGGAYIERSTYSEMVNSYIAAAESIRKFAQACGFKAEEGLRRFRAACADTPLEEALRKYEQADKDRQLLSVSQAAGKLADKIGTSTDLIDDEPELFL
jgi:hypothetical protein